MLLALACLAAAPLSMAGLPDVYEKRTPKAVQDVLDDAEFAVTDRNYRIVGRLNIGQAIRERDHVDFPEYRVILFCNAGLARQMLERDPRFINFCPGRLMIRTEGADTVVSVPVLPEDSRDAKLNRVAAHINRLLREMVDYAARPWSPTVNLPGRPPQP